MQSIEGFQKQGRSQTFLITEAVARAPKARALGGGPGEHAPPENFEI